MNECTCTKTYEVKSLQTLLSCSYNLNPNRKRKKNEKPFLMCYDTPQQIYETEFCFNHEFLKLKYYPDVLHLVSK